MATKEEVMGLISEVLKQDLGTFGLKDHFVEDLGASSLDIMKLVMCVEQYYMLGETPDEQLEQVQTVGDLVDLVSALRHGEPSVVEELMDVAIASDHAGVSLKAELTEWLRRQGHSVLDLGPGDGAASVDYPDFAQLVGQRVVQGDAVRGILLCGTGLGMSMAANKLPGVRAALVSEPVSAMYARQHNDANILCLGSRMIGPEMARACIEAFMLTDFTPGDDGRHRRRIQRMMTLSDSF